MTSGDVVFDKRIQASIPADLKVQVRTLVESGSFESEAEVVRAALWQFVGSRDLEPDPVAQSASPESLPAPDTHHPTEELQRDLKTRLDLLAWLMTIGLLLMARTLRTLGDTDTESMRLIEQAVNEATLKRNSMRRKLALGWRAFNHAAGDLHSTNGSNGQQ